MAVIRISDFAGMTPKAASRLLDGDKAVNAVNCKLGTGDLHPFRGLLAVHKAARKGFLRTIHRFADDIWLHWNEDVDVARGPIAGDVLSRTYFTGTDLPRVTDASLVAAGGGTAYPARSYVLGVPAPESAPTVTPGSGGAEDKPDSRAYAYTFVTGWGEEGAPSPPSDVVEVLDGQEVTLSGMSLPPAGDYNIVARRVYRTSAGAGGADFLFVAEITADAETFLDTTLTDDLGEVLPSASWLPPPTNLRGLIALPNGVFAGFSGNEVCFSEPWLPHAWPSEYRVTTDQPVVALGAFGSTVVVATTSYPYLVTGTDPASTSMAKLPDRQPCVAKRGLVSCEYGVLYPAPDGLFLVGPGGSGVVTQGILTRDDWLRLNPATIHAVYHDGKYVAFYETGVVNGSMTGGGFILDRVEPTATLTELGFYAYAGHCDAGTDALYLVEQQHGDNYVEVWEGKETLLSYSWRSKTFSLPAAGNLGAIRVKADFPDVLSPEEQAAEEERRRELISANEAVLLSGVPLAGAVAAAHMNLFMLNGDILATIAAPYTAPESLHVRVYADGELRHSANVAAEQVVRLPSGYTARDWEVEVSGTIPVREIVLASSATECGQ